MKYRFETSTNALEEFAKTKSHNTQYNQTDVVIPGIPETELITETEFHNILTDKGILIIDYGMNESETKHVYVVYNIFDFEESANFDSVGMVHSNIENRNPEIENIHKIVLYKNSDNIYYAKPTQLGKENGNYLYRLDIDRFKIGDSLYNPDARGLFTSSQEITSVNKFGLSYKEYFYFNVDGSNSSYKIVFEDEDYGIKLLKKNVYYIDIHNANEDINIDVLDGSKDYLFFSLKGTSSTPASIILEVY